MKSEDRFIMSQQLLKDVHECGHFPTAEDSGAFPWITAWSNMHSVWFIPVGERTILQGHETRPYLRVSMQTES